MGFVEFIEWWILLNVFVFLICVYIWLRGSDGK